ncbi:MAG TPA: S-layer homology domain-containing protein, partial [Thermoleophilia bacterium]|nr:S-layer homology domain-containing protein [Thermoleophilia bacterium]
MKISKRMLFILVPVLVLVLTGAVAFAAVGGPFPDVPATHWAYSNIMKLAGQGVIVGYQDGT